MPAKRKKLLIEGKYFTWLLGQRNGVYYVDGRSNNVNLGRHSLGTKDRDAALSALTELDLVKAVEQGLASAASLSADSAKQLNIAEGRKLYMAHVGRPRVVGGARPSSSKRYRAVLDKFEAFLIAKGIGSWNQVNREILEAYATYLENNGYAGATAYLELTSLKQLVKFLVDTQRLPASCQIRLPLSKPHGTTTYCWRPEQVAAMLKLCYADKRLKWLGDVIAALACTGLRISELASLRWSDVDADCKMINLTDESGQSRKGKNVPARQTKSGRSRSFPIHDDLRRVLNRMGAARKGPIFHGPLGGRLKPDTVRKILVRDVLTPLRERFPAVGDEVGFQDGRLHSFRHYFCSTCANSGVPEEVVMRWLGHRDSDVVKIYYHLHDDEAQRQMKRLTFLGDASGSVAPGEV